MTSMTARTRDDHHDATRQLQQAFQRALDERVGESADFAAREAAGLELANELCWADQHADLCRRSALFVSDELWIDGKHYRRHSTKMGQGKYGGLCGMLVVPRALYREVGVRNGRTVVPLELDAGLVERATPALANALAQGYADAPSRQVHKAMKACHRQPPSRSTTERAGKAIGRAMGLALPRIEPAIRAFEQLPAGTCAVSVGLDRTSVPMEEPAGPDKLPVKRTTPRLRKAPAPVEVNYRMAYVGTFTLLDADGRGLVTRRYGIAGDMDPEPILQSLRDDLAHALQQQPGLPVGLLQDGAPEMWNLMRGCLADVDELDQWFEAIDRHHLLERLGDALRRAGLVASWRTRQLAEWSDSLDKDDATIDHIEQFVRTLRDGLRGEARRKLSEHVTYIENNKDRMRYVRLRNTGLPVGSGATEGACKSLVMIRAKACGQRWHDDGIDAVFVLRGLSLSDRLPHAMELLRRDYSATVRLAA